MLKPVAASGESSQESFLSSSLLTLHRNFELPRVRSINTSGHKYGLVYAGVGWIIWRDQAYLPKHLIFELHYLGGTEKSFTLNFSRPGAQVIMQYYQLIHLGFNGYRQIMENCLANARLLSRSLEATGWYTCVSDIHRPVQRPSAGASVAGAVKSAVTGSEGVGEPEGETSAGFMAGLPVVSFRLSDDFREQFPCVQQETVSLLLRARQWIIPNYPLPPGEDQTEILRVVIRESMSFDLLDRLVADIVETTEMLMEKDRGDLSILRLPKRKVQCKSEKQEREAEEEKGGEKVTKVRETRKMQGGIHRSVC